MTGHLAGGLTGVTRLVLTGFMGSGKTTVGRALAHRLRWEFIDLDDHVASREGCSVPALIAEHGEAAFRHAETAALQDLLLRPDLVLALGGGAPESPAVCSSLQTAAGTLVIYLQAPFDLLYQRCLVQARDLSSTRRPFLSDPESTGARYHRRIPLYEQLAQLTIDASVSSPNHLVDAIYAGLTC